MRPFATLTVFVLASLALACADSATAPALHTPGAAYRDCRGGFIIVDGRSVCSDSAGDGLTVTRPAHPPVDSSQDQQGQQGQS